ncbi:MAG: DMT family transporter [bacterium]
MSARDIVKGIAWMLGAEALFVASWCAIKFLGGRLPLFEIVFFRALLSLFVLVPLTYFRLGHFRFHDRRALFMRSFFGYLAMFSSFYAMIHLRLGNASTLINTMPIFVALFSTVLVREPFSRRQFLFILIAFAGISMILKPDAGILSRPSLIGLFAGVMSALAMIGLRKLHSTDTTMIITLYFTAFSALVSVPMALYKFIWPTPYEWIWLIFIGAVITFAQLFMTRAYKYGNASTIAPFSYASVIGAFVAGLILFGEVPDIWSIGGAVVIVASGIGVMLAAPRARKGPVLEPQGVT